MVAGRDSEAGVAVDDSRGASGNRDVRKQSHNQAGTDRRSLDGGDDRLRAVNDVVNEVPGLAEHPNAGSEVVCHLGDQVQITTR
jgi:hypothetical protein